MDGTIAEIRMFAGNFAPRNWFLCEGQILPIAQYQAFFSLVGTIYGGDGRTTFGIPDLRGRVVIGEGFGPGLTNRPIGQKSGAEGVTLNQSQIPSHSHSITNVGMQASSANATQSQPTQGSSLAAPGMGSGRSFTNTLGYNTATPDVTLNSGSTPPTIGNTGGNLSHTNMQPFLVLNYIICYQGIYPSRN